MRLYAFGFLLGCLIVSFFYKGSSCQMPGSRKMEELSLQKLIMSPGDTCRLQCMGVMASALPVMLRNGKINYDKSEVRAEPYGKYLVETRIPQGASVEVLVEDHDSLTVFRSLSGITPADTCGCP